MLIEDNAARNYWARDGLRAVHVRKDKLDGVHPHHEQRGAVRVSIYEVLDPACWVV